MVRALKIAFAFMGIIIGAGFASGQEILQYFTSFGLRGAAAGALATVLFAYLGMTLTKLGSRLGVASHKKAIYKISGRYIGLIVDVIIILTLFGVGVVMIAGAGSTLNQQFGLPFFAGSLLMTILVIVSMMFKVDKVIAIIATITPFLIIFIVIISIYSIFTTDTSLIELHPIAVELAKSFPNWFVSAVNYVSFNIAVGASMSLVVGGAEKNEKIASIGGFLGGIGIGVLILLSYFAIFANVKTAAQFDLPLLHIVEQISPILAFFMSIILYAMIFNTALAMFYGFVARLFVVDTISAKIATVVTCVIGFLLSFIGFTTLVAKFYSIIGYMGLFLMFALFYAPFKLKKDNTNTLVP